MRKTLAMLSLLVPALAAPLPPSDARLMTSDSAEPIDHVVLGLQRTAVPLFAGVALDSSLYADLALAPNVGLRWSGLVPGGRAAVGARWTQFVGASVYSSVVSGQQPLVQRFEPSLSGPTVYAVYGYFTEGLRVTAEARWQGWTYRSLAATLGVALPVTAHLTVTAEATGRGIGTPTAAGAVGVRYGGEHLGAGLGVAYVGVDDPLLGFNLPIMPVLDLSWSFR